MLSGPSGAGKSTLLKRLMKEHEGVFGFSVSRKFVGQQAVDLPILPEGEVGQQLQSLGLCNVNKPFNAETEVLAAKTQVLMIHFWVLTMKSSPHRHDEKPSTRRGRWQRYGRFGSEQGGTWILIL